MLRKILPVLVISLLFVSAIAAQGTSTSVATPAAITGKPAKAPVFRSTKAQVKEAQTMLKTKKLFSGEATGVSSAEWKTAVKAYQGDNGLTKTGSLNRATLEKMGIALTDKQQGIPVNPNTIASGSAKSSMSKTSDKAMASTTPMSPSTASGDGPKRPAPFQATKDQITALQKVLKDGKMFDGEANGERSDALKDAVKKYQEANGLKVTGGINAPTLGKASIELTDKQKEQVAAQAAYDAAKKN